MKNLINIIAIVAILGQNIVYNFPGKQGNLDLQRTTSSGQENSRPSTRILNLLHNIYDFLFVTPTSNEVLVSADSAYPAPVTVTPTPLITETISPTLSASPTIVPTSTSDPTQIPTTPPIQDQEGLSLELASKRIKPGDEFPIRWEVQGLRSLDPSKRWMLIIDIPTGLIVPDNTTGTYDSVNSQLRYNITLTKGDFSLRAANDFLGTQPIRVRLFENETVAADASLSIVVKNWVFVSNKGGEVSGLNGKVKVKIPASAIPENIEAAIGWSTPGKLPFSYSGYPIEISAEGLQSQKQIHQFTDTITLEMTYDETQVHGDPSSQAWYYFDYDYQTWIPIPSEVDTVNHVVRGYTTHLSDWEVNPRDWLSAKIPLATNADVSLFSGAATYSLPISVPQGPGGITPTISLNYNSQIVDATSNNTQASWVGMGWDLSAGGVIRRNMGNNSLTDLNDDTFTVSLAGQSYTLIPTNKLTNYVEYKTSEETFWRIRRYTSSTTVSADNAYQYTKEFDTSYWEILDKLGNQFLFKFRAHYVNYIYPISYPVWGWYLSEIKYNPGGTYKYFYRSVPLHKCYGLNPPTNCYYSSSDIAIYLEDIVYPDNHTRIHINREIGRTDYDHSWETDSSWVLYEKDRVKSIQVLYDDVITYGTEQKHCKYVYLSNPQVCEQYGGSIINVTEEYNFVANDADVETIIREYKLDYFNKDEDQDGNGNKDFDEYGIFPKITWPISPTEKGITLVLRKITEFGIGGSAGGNRLPSISFLYDGMHLKSIDNGLGGTVSFNYDSGWSASNAAQSRVSTIQYPENGTNYYRYFEPNEPNLTPSYAGPWGYFKNTPLAIFYPGGFYKFKCTQLPTSVYSSKVLFGVKFGYQPNGQIDNQKAIKTSDINLSNGAYEGSLKLSALASTAFPYIQSRDGNTGYVSSCQTHPLLTRYSVTSKTITDGRGSSYTFNYDYSGGITKVNETAETPVAVESYSQFRGHSLVSITDPYNLRTKIQFFQEDGLVGKTDWIEQYDVSTSTPKLMTKTDYQWEKTQTAYEGTSYCAKTTTGCLKDQDVFVIKTSWDANYTYSLSGSNVMGTKRTYAYDSYNNVTEAKESSLKNSVEVLYRTTQTQYKYNTTLNLLGVPVVINQFDCSDGSCSSNIKYLTASSCFIYRYSDGSTDIYPVCSIGQDANGNVINTVNPDSTKVVVSPLLFGKRVVIRFNDLARLAPKYHDERFEYDSWGNQTRVTVFAGEGESTGIASVNPQITNLYYDPYFSSFLTKKEVIKQVENDSSEITFTTEWISNLDTTNGVYDRYLRVPSIIKDENYIETTYKYDGFGRPTEVRRPYDDAINGNATTVIRYPLSTDPLPYKVRVEQKIDNTQSIVVVNFMDGLGRLIQEQTVGATLAGGSYNLVKDHRYNSYGREIYSEISASAISSSQNESFVVRDIPSDKLVTTIYDPAGRVTMVQSPDGNSTQYNYDVVLETNVLVREKSVSASEGYNFVNRDLLVFLTSIIDSKANISKSMSDYWGRTVREKPAAGTQINTYAYDTNDHLAKVRQPMLNNSVPPVEVTIDTTIIYDLGGRKTSMIDPDMGAWQYQFDAVGNLIKQIDAKANQICLYYDTLNRLRGKVSSNSTICDPAIRPSQADQFTDYYQYDQGGATNLALGRMTNMKDGSGETLWTYDLRGRLVKEVKTVKDGTQVLGAFETSWSYLSNDQIMWMRYPNKEEVTFHFNKQGLLNQVSSLSIPTIVSNVYDESGRVDSRTFGNGVQIDYEFYPWNNRNISGQLVVPESAKGGALRWIHAGLSGSPSSLMELDYVYDPNGNIKTITDARNAGQKQCFTYDALNRLVMATTNGDAQQGCSTSVGEGPYHETYSYNSVTGLLTQKTGAGQPGALSYDFPTHPHAVKKVGGIDYYSYDANGNMTSRKFGTDQFTLSYDPENRLIDIMKGANSPVSRYAFDGQGNRVLAVVTKTTDQGPIERKTIYIGNYFEATYDPSLPPPPNGGTQSVTCSSNCIYLPVIMRAGPDEPLEDWEYRSYFYAGSTQIAVHVQGGDRARGGVFYYFLRDHLGSTSIAVKQDGLVEGSVVRYSPWGDPRPLPQDRTSTSLDGITAYQYTGQSKAEAGLYFFGSRWYDSWTGRFVQSDTVIPNMGVVLEWDRYAYTLNNPIRYTDPSGHRPCSDDPNYMECEKGLPHAPKYSDQDPVTLDTYYPAADIRSLYIKYKYTKGWWNDDGYGSAYFTELNFLELMLSYEFSTLPTPDNFAKYYPGKLEALSHATSHWFNSRCELFSGGACSGVTPNSVFNFLAASESMYGKMEATFSGRASLGSVTKFEEARMSVAHSVVTDLVNPPDPEWRRGGGGSQETIIESTHPYTWGNRSMLPGDPLNPIWKYGLPGQDIFYILPVDVKY